MPILTICGILIVVLGVLIFMYAKFFFAMVPKNGGKSFHFFDFFLQNSILCCFWSKLFIIFAFRCVWPPCLEGVCFIYFGATEKDLGYL